MQKFDINKVVMVVFLIGILATTFFNQSLNNRRRVNVASLVSNSQSEPSDTKKQVPVSTNLITEEEDKIVEEIECICSEHHPILISVSFAFPTPIFEEPYLKVVTLPPWA
jgi:hypothetical protein